MSKVRPFIDKLNSFETGQEVADFLRTQNIKGHRADSEACIISNWAGRESGEFYITTSSSVKVWENEMHYEEFLNENIWISAAVDEFIQRFDYGEYPDLAYDAYEDSWSDGDPE